MRPLTKIEAEKISQITSEIYEQGNLWVFQEFDLKTGVKKLTRGLSRRAATKRLRSWRKERIELLLRECQTAPAYTLRKFHKNPNWNDNGVWHWIGTQWYTSKEEAEKALEKKQPSCEQPCEIHQMTIAELPGHFVVA